MAKSNSDYSELALGFIEGGLGIVGPLVHKFAPDVKITVLIKLQGPDRSVLIDMRDDPVKVVVDTTEKQGDVTITIDAQMFHYLLWGKLSPGKAVNEKIMLLERNPMTPLDIPAMGDATDTSPMEFDNLLYEAYLINRGAAHLLLENDMPDILNKDRKPKNITLDTPIKSSVAGVIGRAGAYGLGYAAGLFLPRLIVFVQQQKPLPPPQDMQPIRLDFNEMAKAKKNGESSKARNALMKIIFTRLDLFDLGGALTRGMKATGKL